MNTSIRSRRETKRGGSPRPGLPFCFSRASDAGIHADVDDSNAERIDVEVLTRIRRVFEASNPFSVHQKVEKSEMFRMKFWTSENLVEKWSKRLRDHHNRIRLEKLCPKVVSDRQNAGRMPSKRRFLHFCPIIENCLLYTSPSPRDMRRTRMPSSA